MSTERQWLANGGDHTGVLIVTNAEPSAVQTIRCGAAIADRQQVPVAILSVLSDPLPLSESARMEDLRGPRADTRRRKEVLDRCLACRRWYGHSIRQPVERWRLLQTLLECGADPNAKVDGMTAIQRAAGEIGPDQDTGNPEASPGGDAQNDEIRKEIDVLRKHGAAIDLVSAVAIGDEAEVARLLKQNPRSASSRRLDGYPVLHWSVTMNYEGIVKQLLDAGCDVEIRNRSRHTACDGTALHEAACWGRFSIAKMLLAHGAKVNAISANHQWTPLHEAAYAGDAKVAGLLLRNGANLDAKDDEGNTPLQVCQAKSRRQAVALRAVFREYARTAKGGSRR